MIILKNTEEIVEWIRKQKNREAAQKEIGEMSEMKFHNHCWREDGSCYGAYADEPDGICKTKRQDG